MAIPQMLVAYDMTERSGGLLRIRAMAKAVRMYAIKCTAKTLTTLQIYIEYLMQYKMRYKKHPLLCCIAVSNP